jgi:biotin transport system substrate-specific component
MTVRAPALTMIDAARPRNRTLLWDSGLVLAFGTLMALFARISIPLVPVPITGQTLGVLLIGALLGSRRGGLAMLAYLGEGLIGLPVFALGHSAWTPVLGVPVILGPTAGYLISYPIAAFAVGWLAERGWDRSFWRSVLAMLAGEILIYCVGLPWLAHFVGPRQTLPLGLLPFIPGDTIKLLLAAAVLPSGWKLLGARAHGPDAV